MNRACPAKPWRSGGFTLIELLVVMFIIGILASLVVVNVSEARKTSRDAKRMANLRTIQAALEQYNDKNGSYPLSSAGSVGADQNIVTSFNKTTNPWTPIEGTVLWSGQCGFFTNSSTTLPNLWLKDLVPTYISTLPQDPKMDWNKCYAYASDGIEYKLMDRQGMETVCKNSYGDLDASASCNTSSIREMADPGEGNKGSIAVYTSGAVNWTR